MNQKAAFDRELKQMVENMDKNTARMYVVKTCLEEDNQNLQNEVSIKPMNWKS